MVSSAYSRCMTREPRDFSTLPEPVDVADTIATVDAEPLAPDGRANSTDADQAERDALQAGG